MVDKFIKTKETMEETIQLLKKNKKCLIVRPTGFGKTWILANIVSLYDRVIYFYPTDIISLDVKNKYKSILKGKDITFISYHLMVNIYKRNEIKKSGHLARVTNSKKTLFILDEAHLAGGNKISKALDELFDIFPNAHVLGATATPNRTDYFNIRYHFFNGIEVSKYGITDAINDGLFQKPYYVSSTFEIERNFENLKRSLDDIDISKDRKNILSDIIKSSEIKYMNLYNEKEIIKNYIKTAGHNKNYMKFICFFSDSATLYSKVDRIVQNFEKIYPSHSINPIIVLSDTTEHKKNLFKIQELKKRNKTIDIIFCIDMLNMGYHVPDINGIIMYRNTYSDIIYVQQLGRCISVDSDIRPIIFDFVGNYTKHNSSEYNTVIGNNKSTKKKDIDEFDKDNVELIDHLKEFEELERLIQNEIRLELEDAIIDAYMNKNAPIKYCLYELKLETEKDFLDLIERRKNEFG